MATRERKVLVVATLRHNIDIDSDVTLAAREFSALTQASDWRTLHDWQECLETPIGRLPTLVQSRVQATLRPGEPVAFLAETTASSLERLLRHSAFAQEVVGIAPPNWGGDSALVERFGQGVFLGVPVVALSEYASELLGETPKGSHERLDRLLRFLLTGDAKFRSPEVVRAVHAKKTTLSLTHDLHIYKAKFFPRMVHAIQNIFAAQIGSGALVDPFCGSGTALLEGSLGSVQSFGIDLDPLSALISKCKVEPFTRGRKATRTLLKTLQDGIHSSEGPLFRSQKRVTSSALPDELRGKLQRRDQKNGTSFLPEIESDLGTLLELRERFSKKEPGLLEVLLSDAVTKKIRYRFVGVGNGKYTIEVVKQPILERFEQKVRSTLAICDVFEWLEMRVGVSFAASSASIGDATTLEGLPNKLEVGGCITSPPYLPASSGREHYAPSRAVALSVTGLADAMRHDRFVGTAEVDDESRFDPKSLTPAGQGLLQYLLSDKSDNADPQRDAMRFARKAIPSWRYLVDIERFMKSLRKRTGENGVCVLVVASQHTFYSHRRLQEAKQNGDEGGAVEYVAKGSELYGQIAVRAGWNLDEEIQMQLAKSATSMARPRSKDEYSESILVLRPRASG